jgi:hypothetical protein
MAVPGVVDERKSGLAGRRARILHVSLRMLSLPHHGDPRPFRRLSSLDGKPLDRCVSIRMESRQQPVLARKE